MQVRRPQAWPASTTAAIALQERLRREVIAEDRLGPVRRVAAVDVGYEKGGAVTRAAAVVLTLAGLELCDRAVARRPTTFPYVPGLLAFREVPAVLDALERLAITPDVVLCDGHGIAHPRRFGIACHIGLLAGVPTIGVAKSRYVGEHAEPEPERGAWAPLVDGGEVIGAALRTRARVRPVYVSVGHRVGLETAIDTVLRCTTRFRLPEPIREADRLSRREPLGQASTADRRR